MRRTDLSCQFHALFDSSMQEIAYGGHLTVGRTDFKVRCKSLGATNSSDETGPPRHYLTDFFEIGPTFPVSPLAATSPAVFFVTRSAVTPTTHTNQL